MNKIFDLDLSGYEFKCAKCGKCCFRAVIPVPVEMKIDGYSHNYRGEFVLKPKTTVAFFYTEKPRMEQIIRKRFKIEPKFYPQITMYCKDFPVGFITIYQIATKKNSCMFYDANARKCQIYAIRPLSCQVYPLMLNLKVDRIPEIAVDCTVLEDELKRRIPDLSDDHQVLFKTKNTNDMLMEVFPVQYELYIKKYAVNIRKMKIFMSETQKLWIRSNEITPERVEGYTLLDASHFFSWARKNLQGKINVDELLRKIKNIEKE